MKFTDFKETNQPNTQIEYSTRDQLSNIVANLSKLLPQGQFKIQAASGVKKNSSYQSTENICN